MPLRVIIDGSSEYPIEKAKQQGIIIVPVIVLIDGEEYLDPGDNILDSVYTRFETDPDFYPTTSQPSPGLFYEAYEQALNEGATDLLVITVSSALSGTFNSAQVAANEFKEINEDINFYFVDSRSTASAIIFLADEAIHLQQQGKSPKEIYQTLLQVRRRIKTFAYLSTLKYLYKSGRINRAKYYIGSFLHLRVLAEFTESGKITPIGVFRNHEQGLKRIVETATSKGKAAIKRIAIHHANSLVDAEKLKELTHQYKPGIPLELHVLRFSLLVHGGPKTIGYIVQYDSPSND